MKSKTVAIVAIIILASISGTALAGDSRSAMRDRGPGMFGDADPQRMVARISRYLELDEAQHQELENIALAAEPGISALDTLLVLALRLVEEDVLSLPEMIARLTLNPARIFGLPGGRIAIGEAADLILVDPDAHRICRAADFVSKGRNTAFEGWDFNGSVTHTLIGGDVVYGN